MPIGRTKKAEPNAMANGRATSPGPEGPQADQPSSLGSGPELSPSLGIGAPTRSSIDT